MANKVEKQMLDQYEICIKSNHIQTIIENWKKKAEHG